MSTIAAIILTYNEELHIARCINSLKGIVDEIYVVDSFSNDRTIEIVNEFGVKVIQNRFVNQATQFNWALNTCDIESDWILRIDADEYIDNKNNINLHQKLLDLPSTVTGLLVSRKIIFMGKPLLHGGWYPKWNLRIFRTGIGKCENRWMDEHIILSEGSAVQLQLDFVDNNLNDLSWWIAKHNDYASREAKDFFLTHSSLQVEKSVSAKFWGNDAERKRWLKLKYMNFPLFVRPFINFIYRYILLRGFLDGKQGLIWHFQQGLWYRFLVDTKIYELKSQFNNDKDAILKFINKNQTIK
ncbi:MAG: glycosyltransferase family 2 protein [Paludibacter sp.]|nr:glycosyltransferase family 2 protein [Paludibacter sp.]